MKKVMFTNTTDKIQYPGGKAVRLGDCRMIYECYCPKHKDESQPEMFEVSTYLKQKAVDAISQINELSDEHLAMAIAAEESKKKSRKSLLDALGSELDKRDFEKATEIVKAELIELETEELQARLLDEGNSDELNELIQSVLDGRKSKEGEDESNQAD